MSQAKHRSSDSTLVCEGATLLGQYLAAQRYIQSPSLEGCFLVLYLAELNKPIVGKPSVVLLARQQQDSWQVVSEETVPIQGGSPNIKDGSLVLVDLGANRQISRITEAAKQVVTYLQNYSRVQERAREQEKGIEEWKESLNFQSAELQRRLSELDSQEDQVRQLYEKYQHAEEESRILEAKREELASLESHLHEQQKRVGQQREALQHQQEQLSQHLADAQQSRLGEAEAAQLQTLLSQLAQDLQAMGDPPACLQTLLARLSQEEQGIQQAWAELEQERQQAQTAQGEVDQALQHWEHQRQSWLEAQGSLEQMCSDVRTQEALFAARQQQLQYVTQATQQAEEALQSASTLLRQHSQVLTAEGGSLEAATPSLSLPDLEAQIDQKRRLYEQRSGQVNQQLAELEQSRQAVEDLQTQLATAGPDEQMDIEMDLDYAREAYKTLEETILPQQDSLGRDYQELMKQEALLAQMKGTVTPDVAKVDISPLLSLLQQQRQAQQTRKATLETDLQKAANALRPLKQTLEQTTQAHLNQWQDLLNHEGSLRAQLQAMSEHWGRIHQQQGGLEYRQTLLQSLQEAIQPSTGSLHHLQGLIADSQTQLASMTGILTMLMDPDHAQDPLAS